MAGQPRDSEESPDFIRQRCRITSGWSNPRDSATEIRQPRPVYGASGDKVKRCGKSAPGFWQQDPHGKPHRKQGQIGVACASARGGLIPATRVDCSSRPVMAGIDEWLPPGNRYRIRLTGHPRSSAMFWFYLVQPLVLLKSPGFFMVLAK